MLEDFLERERTAGEAVGGEATFTLDPNKVRERVASFCRENTLYPLLRCLQAIISVCDGDVFILREEETWSINFQWPGCPSTRAFEDLLNLGTTAGFDRVGHSVGQHLFFGLSAALGTDHYDIEWNSSQAHFLAKNKTLTPLKTEQRSYSTLSFKLESKWWQRLLGQNQVDQINEDLRRRLCYSPKPIHLEQKRIRPESPTAPEQPWRAKLVQGSDLAWRFIRKPDQNLLSIPYPDLDHYRCNKEGQVFHLVSEPQGDFLPLSVAFYDPGRKTLKKGQTSNLSLSHSARAHSALFLSLETGRQDWLIPVRDGVTAEPVAVNLTGGGIIAVSSERSLHYDLSGLKVIENEAFEDLLAMLRVQTKSMKKQLAVSVANVSVRSKTLPKQYDQALSYLVGGPYAGLIGGRFGQFIRRLSTPEESS